MSVERVLEAAVAEGQMRPIDLAFARFIARLDGEGGDGVVMAAVLVSARVGAGDVCLDLGAHAGQRVLDTRAGPLRCPTLESWLAGLAASPAVGSPGTSLPLVLDPAGRLYLARYWHYEAEVARLAGVGPQVQAHVAGPHPGAH
ncbi:MAG: hypothetical protein R3263_08200, partial [Myxococcota bacterium]|nr:hypothetical protein [Myxococcota bacterium]